MSYYAPMLKIETYVDAGGDSPFTRWFDRLDARAAAKVTTALSRIERGNLSNAKGVGVGVIEYRIDFGPGYRIYFGPGYRIYFGRVGATLIVLLGGGTKARQQRDIEAARCLWREYRQRRRQEEDRGPCP